MYTLRLQFIDDLKCRQHGRLRCIMKQNNIILLDIPPTRCAMTDELLVAQSFGSTSQSTLNHCRLIIQIRFPAPERRPDILRKHADNFMNRCIRLIHLLDRRRIGQIAQIDMFIGVCPDSDVRPSWISSQSPDTAPLLFPTEKRGAHTTFLQL